MEEVKFCKNCDTVVFIPIKEGQDVVNCPRCGEVFINNTYTISSDDEEIKEDGRTILQ
jgi:DNA-directed RNA polymerase subunit M/transcription elongation factor TFIIS